MPLVAAAGSALFGSAAATAATIGTAASVGASIYGANKQARSAKDATNAANAANERNIQDAQAQREFAQQAMQPYVARGNRAQNYLDTVYYGDALPTQARPRSQVQVDRNYNAQTPLQSYTGAPQQRQAPMASLPPAAQHIGRKVRDTRTGQVLVSDGRAWSPQVSNAAPRAGLAQRGYTDGL